MVNLQRKEEKPEVVMKKEMKMPHTLGIVFGIILLVAIATYFVPGGAYERIVNEAGRTVVVDGTFSYIESNPQGLFAILQAPFEGIMSAAEIIAFASACTLRQISYRSPLGILSSCRMQRPISIQFFRPLGAPT